MTSSERSRCEDIIHSCAVAGAGGQFMNPIKIPGIGTMAVDSVVIIGMAVKLAAVFGNSVSKGSVEGTALAALKEAYLNNMVKTAAKTFFGSFPFIGDVLTSGLTIAIIEEAGWTLAEQFDNAR